MLIETLKLIANGYVSSKKELINKLNINGTTLDDIISMLVSKDYLQLKTEKKPSFCHSCVFSDNCKNGSVLCKAYAVTNKGLELEKMHKGKRK